MGTWIIAVGVAAVIALAVRKLIADRSKGGCGGGCGGCAYRDGCRKTGPDRKE